MGITHITDELGWNLSDVSEDKHSESARSSIWIQAVLIPEPALVLPVTLINGNWPGDKGVAF